MKIESFEISRPASVAGPDGIIRGDVRVQAEGGKKPVVILCHGFKGFKDWGFFPYVSEQFAAAGFFVTTINFSHNGVGASLTEFDELEKFRENTFSLEIEDLSLVLEAVKESRLPLAEFADSSSLGLVGHSRGGVAVLGNGSVEGVRAIATLASITRVPAVSSAEEKAWREAGVFYVENARTGQQMPLGVSFLEEMLSFGPRIQSLAENASAPLLVVHGDLDETVPIDSAYQLSEWNKQASLKIIEGANHAFGAKHPFLGAGPHFGRACFCCK